MNQSEPDFVESLGALGADHLLKRLMLRLLKEAESTYRDLALPLKPRWCSTLLLLDGEGPLTIREIAERLRLTHPAVVQILNDMDSSGLVRRSVDPRDARCRAVRLTRKGKRWMPKFRRVWEALRRAQEEVFVRAGFEVPAALDRVHRELDQETIEQRVRSLLHADASAKRSPVPTRT